MIATVHRIREPGGDKSSGGCETSESRGERGGTVRWITRKVYQIPLRVTSTKGELSICLTICQPHSLDQFVDRAVERSERPWALFCQGLGSCGFASNCE